MYVRTRPSKRNSALVSIALEGCGSLVVLACSSFLSKKKVFIYLFDTRVKSKSRTTKKIQEVVR
jgi:hypothetical protein